MTVASRPAHEQENLNIGDNELQCEYNHGKIPTSFAKFTDAERNERSKHATESSFESYNPAKPPQKLETSNTSMRIHNTERKKAGSWLVRGARYHNDKVDVERMLAHSVAEPIKQRWNNRTPDARSWGGWGLMFGHLTLGQSVSVQSQKRGNGTTPDVSERRPKLILFWSLDIAKPAGQSVSVQSQSYVKAVRQLQPGHAQQPAETLSNRLATNERFIRRHNQDAPLMQDIRATTAPLSTRQTKKYEKWFWEVYPMGSTVGLSGN
ncbi:hypothetical protein HYFRA_00012871 [Hymenoscyphus fraxineus]|uniref:Uncharacterized protein n=1 Tax=Hymenoscyphus fraxineus TaxID=746836 RepID=A0A9N9PX93_9HELO|nr:hypothetical protein HYFRA_00012871 [Hymenoscyphus fraxineus]